MNSFPYTSILLLAVLGNLQQCLKEPVWREVDTVYLLAIVSDWVPDDGFQFLGPQVKKVPLIMGFIRVNRTYYLQICHVAKRHLNIEHFFNRSLKSLGLSRGERQHLKQGLHRGHRSIPALFGRNHLPSLHTLKEKLPIVICVYIFKIYITYKEAIG